MKRFLIILTIFTLAGCSTPSQTNPTPTPQVESFQQQISSLQDRIAKQEADLKAAQGEIRWLHIHFTLSPSLYAPRAAIERYGEALVERNGAVARLYLAEPIRGQMPAQGIGVSNPHLKRVVVLDEKKIDESTYQFKVQMYSEYTGSPEAAGPVQAFTVKKMANDTGNESWLITDIAN